ncbi:hypothetical protein EQ500_13525, partial [Lactobacillus sp. XV13L]|nr:hypothetical protein [Lactobacillus sp. XV13L]
MSSIRRLLKAHARRLVLISFVALGLLVAFYALAGLARGLGKRAAVYQLLMPNSFYSLIAFINVLFIAVAQPLPSSLEQIRLRQKEDWLKTVIGWLLLSSLWT